MFVILVTTAAALMAGLEDWRETSWLSPVYVIGPMTLGSTHLEVLPLGHLALLFLVPQIMSFEEENGTAPQLPSPLPP